MAGSDLSRLVEAFGSAGLATEYGGVHSNGLTHMALAGFADGSYIELISTVQAGQRAPWWPEHIAGDAGPCGWCVRVEDIGAECERLKSRNVPARGPQAFHRKRADGQRVEWDLVFPDDGPPGAVLPFLIKDRSPRELRVSPTAGLAATGLGGVAGAVIGVRDAAWTVALFEQVYGWTRRETRPDPAFGATVVHLLDTPVTVAEPLSSGVWLARRIARFGECPAGFLLWTADLEHAARQLPAATPGTWLGRPALWFDHDRLAGARIGIIEGSPVYPK